MGIEKIKKSFAVAVAYLLMSSNVSAYNYACFETSDNLASAYGDLYNQDYNTEYKWFVILYENCVAQK